MGALAGLLPALLCKDTGVGDLPERLDHWTEAGLLTAEQAEAISRYERQRSAGGQPDAGPSAHASERPDRRTLGAEAVGYVGAALGIGAVALLLRDMWEELVVGGRLAVVALLTVLLGASGFALRRADTPPMQRLASVLFSGAIIGFGWFAHIVADDVLRLEDVDQALLVGVAAMAVALPAYVGRRRALPQLTLLAAILLTVGALFARAPLPPEPLWAGLAFWALGIAWLLLGNGNWIRPRGVAEVAGGVVGLIALQVASFDDARVLGLGLAVLTAGALVALGVSSDDVHHLAVGAVGLFVFVPQLVFDLFGDAIGAPATLLVVGLLLVLLAVGLGRARRQVGAPASRSAAPGTDGGAAQGNRLTGDAG